MARPIVLGNGELHVGINDYGLVHDFHFPHVGLENHTLGNGLRHRIGVWIDGRISWLDDGDWHLEFDYPHESLIGHTVARNSRMQIILEFDDAVDSDLNVFMRSIHVINTSSLEREVRLFMHQAFVIGDSRGNTDTAQYLPDTDAIMHYRGRRVFLISGENDGQVFDQYSVGLFGIEGHEGSWRDADDGELSNSTVEHGRVDSVIRFKSLVGALSSTRVRYWIAAGTSVRAAIIAHKKIREIGMDNCFVSTAKWWHKWLQPTVQASLRLPPEWRQQFVVSAMMLKAHMDNRGAIIASTDSSMLNYGRDAYSYCWPRDGAYVIWPLMRLGYTDEIERFFDFCRRVLHPNGYLSHKYRSDGALGSSWHTYVHGSRIAPPIQTDETALVLFSFSQYYHQHKSEALLTEYYATFIKPMADFLASYIDDETLLPSPSYDLWEEQFSVSTYTVSVTHASLLAAADLADDAGDSASAVSWRSVAGDMFDSARIRLYSDDRKCLRKGLMPLDEGYEPDDTVDMAAIFGAFMFGLYDIKDLEITNSMQAALDVFDQKNSIGLPRYENDTYLREGDTPISNYWHITSLWYAQYLLESNDVEGAKRMIDWSREHSYASCVMAEQIRPSDGFSTSVAPLAWSHAEFMATLLDYVANDRSR